MPKGGRKLPQPKKAAFLAALSEVGNVYRASKMARVDRNSHYSWLRSDPTYKAKADAAMEQAIEKLEDEARRRAHDGLMRKKFGKDGKPIIDPATGEQYVEHEYSDVLLIFLLKAARPEKYRDRQQIDQNISGRITLDVVVPGEEKG